MPDLSVTTAPSATPAVPPRSGGGGDFASRLLLAETGLCETHGSENEAPQGTAIAGGTPLKGQPPIGRMPNGSNGGTWATPATGSAGAMAAGGPDAAGLGADAMMGDGGLGAAPTAGVPMEGGRPWGKPGDTAPGIDQGNPGADDSVAPNHDTQAECGGGVPTLIAPFPFVQPRTDIGQLSSETNGTGAAGSGTAEAGGGGAEMSGIGVSGLGTSGTGVSGTGMSGTGVSDPGASGIERSGIAVSETRSTGTPTGVPPGTTTRTTTGITDNPRSPTMRAEPPGTRERAGPDQPGLNAPRGQPAPFQAVLAQPAMSGRPASPDTEPAPAGGAPAPAVAERPGARQARGTSAMADPSARSGVTAQAMPTPSALGVPSFNAETAAMILGQETDRAGGVAADPIASMRETVEPGPTLESSRQPFGQGAGEPGPGDHAAQRNGGGAEPRLTQASPNEPRFPAIAIGSSQAFDAPAGETPILDAPIGEPTPAGAAPSQAAPTAVSAAEAAQGPEAPAPSRLADQIAPAIIRLDGGPGGNQRLTIRLDPVELGQLEIRIERSDDATRVNVLVERPETLALLRRDQPALERALDQAGMSSDQRDIVLQLAPAEARPAPEPRPGPQPPPDIASQTGGPGGNNQGGGNPGANSAAGDDPGRAPRHAMGRGHSGGTTAEPGTDPGQRPPDWRRMGLDITA